MNDPSTEAARLAALTPAELQTEKIAAALRIDAQSREAATAMQLLEHQFLDSLPGTLRATGVSPVNAD